MSEENWTEEVDRSARVGGLVLCGDKTDQRQMGEKRGGLLSTGGGDWHRVKADGNIWGEVFWIGSRPLFL